MTVPFFVSDILSALMADGAVGVVPLGHSPLDVELVREHMGTKGDCLEHQMFDGCSFHVFEHSNDNLSGSLNDAKGWRLFLFEGAPAADGSRVRLSPLRPLFWAASGMPLCPATR